MGDYCNCFGFRKKKNANSEESDRSIGPPEDNAAEGEIQADLDVEASIREEGLAGSIGRVFAYEELKNATNNFSYENILGSGGFGAVYKGYIQDIDKVVAVKMLNARSIQGDKEFVSEVVMLSHLRHPNVVTLIGYSTERSERLLVYEYMPLGSLEDHLTGNRSGDPLDWKTRLAIALEAAKGLKYMHYEANRRVIYRDMKPANILLDENFHPRLSDFGLARFDGYTGRGIVASRVLGTEGYCAPEYIRTGSVTKKSDVFSFGVVLLQMVTGYEAVDSRRGSKNANIVEWLRPVLKEKESLAALADTKIYGQFSESVLLETMELATKCVADLVHDRPRITHVVETLERLLTQQLEHHSEGEMKTGARETCEEDEEEAESSSRKGEASTRKKEGKAPLRECPVRARAVAEEKLWGERGSPVRGRSLSWGGSSSTPNRRALKYP